MDEKLVSYLKIYGNPDHLEENIKRLKNGEPVQYIVGTMNFYGYEFTVNKHVLIPRYETEELVDRTINYAKKLNLNEPMILDLGTGSGCIAITLAKEIKRSKVSAVDISKEAITVAKKNAILHNTDIRFIESDMFKKVTGKYDIVISNPPYIDISEEIDEVVRKNEPHLALFAENEGLYYYETILKQANDYLNIPGMIAFEIGAGQGDKVISLAHCYFPDAIIKLEQDLQKRDRFVFVINAK